MTTETVIDQLILMALHHKILKYACSSETSRICSWLLDMGSLIIQILLYVVQVFRKIVYEITSEYVFVGNDGMSCVSAPCRPHAHQLFCI